MIDDVASTDQADGDLAHDLATAAGELLVDLRAELGFSDPRGLRAAGDRRSHDWLMARFAEQHPDDVVLSEEGADDPARLSAERVWIVDPLDGTNEYGEEGRTDWAVHVALWARGRGLVAGAVALPARAMTLSTHAPLPPLPAVGRPVRLAVSRSRPPAWLDAVASRVGGVRTPLGSAGMKAMSVLLGESDAYLHRGPMKEWDSAAPVAVARAAGLHVSALDGRDLDYNKPGRLTEQLLICQPSLAQPLLDACAETGVAGSGEGTPRR
ncbi:MAG TPA: 3'(2'),5'-bisphosphate nucleotidase CysQ [Mycobacteriales bacterium]|nr:3'(2'),5'-bisphosphate nucleotidase CysQ [Mycobacteriales bacterium]